MAGHLLAAAGITAVHTTSGAFTASQSLTTLLTTESLMFAAFNAGIVLAAPAAAPRKISRTAAYRVAKGAVAVLTAVAVAATVAWWQVFGEHWPPAVRTVEAFGIAVGIVSQPIVAGIVAWSHRP